MQSGKHAWTLVLAGGEGRRLSHLTTTSDGVTIPKQFCSLRGGASLLQEALERAMRIAARERTCTIVAAEHRNWWQGPLWGLPASNVIVQPQNRGTANGVLLSLLHILRRDPEARVALLPSDHHVREESVLADSILQAMRRVERRGHDCILLGIEPDEPDPELGYIVPAVRDSSDVCVIEEFIEKPSIELAGSLIKRGALWNGFILVARASALLRVYDRRFPEIVRDMRSAVELDHGRTTLAPATAALYARLPEIDFSRHIAQGHERELRVLRVPPCGWSDLGTPVRVAETLRRLQSYSPPALGTTRHVLLNLSAQQTMTM